MHSYPAGMLSSYPLPLFPLPSWAAAETPSRVIRFDLFPRIPLTSMIIEPAAFTEGHQDPPLLDARALAFASRVSLNRPVPLIHDGQGNPRD